VGRLALEPVSFPAAIRQLEQVAERVGSCGVVADGCRVKGSNAFGPVVDFGCPVTLGPAVGTGEKIAVWKRSVCYC
jgi:hypothetical protein